MGIASFPRIIYLLVVPKTFLLNRSWNVWCRDKTVGVTQIVAVEHVEYLMLQRSKLGGSRLPSELVVVNGQQLGSLAISEQIILFLSLGNRKLCVLVEETMMSQQTCYDSIKRDDYIPVGDIIDWLSVKRLGGYCYRIARCVFSNRKISTNVLAAKKNSRKRSVVSLKDETYMFLFHLSPPHGWDTRCCLRLSGRQVFFD